MVFSWARSVFTRKLVTSPIRIWDGEETLHASDVALAAGFELEMIEASLPRQTSHLCSNSLNSPFGWFCIAARHPNINTAPSLSAQWEFVNLSVSDFSSLHFPSFCNKHSALQLHIPRTLWLMSSSKTLLDYYFYFHLPLKMSEQRWIEHFIAFHSCTVCLRCLYIKKKKSYSLWRFEVIKPLLKFFIRLHCSGSLLLKKVTLYILFLLPKKRHNVYCGLLFTRHHSPGLLSLGFC